MTGDTQSRRLESLNGLISTLNASVGGRGGLPAASLASPKPAARRLGLWPAIALAMLAFLAVSALETFSVNADRPVAVLFPEAVSRDQAFAALVAAGGLPIRPARSALSDGMVWIAAAASPDFFDKVEAYGAWAVINPFAFGGCFLVKPT